MLPDIMNVQLKCVHTNVTVCPRRPPKAGTKGNNLSPTGGYSTNKWRAKPAGDALVPPTTPSRALSRTAKLLRCVCQVALS